MSGVSELSPEHGATERLLLREFSYRINNELAAAISLIAAAAGRCGDDQARGELTSVGDRLQNYAHIHHSLQVPEYTTAIDLAAYLQQLCRAVSRSMLAGEGIELLLSVHPRRMSSDRCWLLGLIVFELIADAASHDFQGRAGTIQLEVALAGGLIECRIGDNGMPSGDGLSIVEALAAGLKGMVERQARPEGTSTIVSIPAHP